MLWHLLYAVGLFIITYSLSSLLFSIYFKKMDNFDEYRFKQDPYFGMFLLFFLSALSLRLLIPDFHDVISPVSTLSFYLPFVFAGLIYFSFLFQSSKLTNVVILACSILSAFLFLKNDSLLFSNLIPASWEKLIFGILIFLITLSSKLLNRLNNIFSAFITTFLVGIVALSLVGGLPLNFGLMAALWVGTWLAYFQFNIFDVKISLNDGAIMSSAFLLSTFLIGSANELSFPSVFILTVYLLAELIWAIVHHFFSKSEATDISEQTVYFNVYQKDVTLFALYIAIFKLGFVNVFLALFQLYAPNAFTLPFLSIIINLWLLSKLNNFDQPDLNLKETSKQFVEDIKENMNEIKNNLKGTDEK